MRLSLRSLHPKNLEPFDWRPAVAAVAVGLLVRFGMIGAIDQVLYSADVAGRISVGQAYAISGIAFWGTALAGWAAGWSVYHMLHRRWAQ